MREVSSVAALLACSPHVQEFIFLFLVLWAKAVQKLAI
jgi:hypothetical protein